MLKCKMSLLVCRSCLDSGGDLVALDNISNYKQIFMNLAGIIVNECDGLPQNICRACAQLFTEFSVFRKKVVRNHQFLVEALERKVIENIELNNTETQEKRLGHIEIEIKEESLDDYPAPEVLEVTQSCSQYENCNETEKKEDLKQIINSLGKKKKKKSKDKTKSKKSSKPLKPLSTTPRIVIEVDPDKITTIRLSEEEQRERHEREATSPGYSAMPHRCHKCYKGFNYERKLIVHLDKYHKDGSKYACKICHRTLVNAASLALHEARHDTLYQCRVCLQSYVEKKQAITHYRSVHEGIEALVLCKYCGQSFRHRSTLNGHMRSRHPQAERPACNTCNKTFVSKDSLLDHLLIHTGEKPHACGSCGKRFRLKAEVVVHARTHTSARPYYCLPCDKHFKTHTSYNNHRRLARAHLDPSMLQQHVCGECGRGFASAWQLRAHAAGHGARAAHACPECGARLSSRAAVRKHIRTTHLHIPPPKNHVCHACGKRFSGSLMLENHIRVHTGEKPFACATGECGARFSQKSTLQTHIRLVHLKLKRGAGGRSQGNDNETSM